MKRNKVKVVKTEDDTPKRRDLVVVALRSKEECPDDAEARTLTRPVIQAASTIKKFEGENHEVNALSRELQRQVDKIIAGDMGRAESMLTAQSHTLDEIFNNLAKRSYTNFNNGNVGLGETYLRLALKSQSQCRATLETLANVKNPPVVYAKQANVTTGPQQINNGVPVREIKNLPNEQSGETLGLYQDAGTPTLTGAANQKMEAVGKVQRPQDRRRKG